MDDKKLHICQIIKDICIKSGSDVVY